jgi:hypothetical protein
MRICTGQSTEVCTLARTGTCHKEGHVSLLRLGTRTYAQNRGRRHNNRKANCIFHLVSLPKDRARPGGRHYVCSTTTSGATFYSIDSGGAKSRNGDYLPSVRYVRFGSEADICAATSDVCFTPDSDQKSEHQSWGMSALPPKADMCSAMAHVCFGPEADITTSSRRPFKG